MLKAIATRHPLLLILEDLHWVDAASNSRLLHLSRAEGFWVASERVNWSILPARVEGVSEQKIGGLEPGLQALLAVASVEGELFTTELVARVQRLEAYEVVQRLSQELDRQQRLVRAEAVEQVRWARR